MRLHRADSAPRAAGSRRDSSGSSPAHAGWAGHGWLARPPEATCVGHRPGVAHDPRRAEEQATRRRSRTAEPEAKAAKRGATRDPQDPGQTRLGGAAPTLIRFLALALPRTIADAGHGVPGEVW
ncbi:hypothetical protein [Rhodobaculum claviforme]|uniref:hypothetical protein n=1 Tax=Rhodobaculum claviforme TaxID=1549854 RepID=UPI001912FDBA|nr:hypothetical protein [Rhodobaculum claviforme]